MKQMKENVRNTGCTAGFTVGFPDHQSRDKVKGLQDGSLHVLSK